MLQKIHLVEFICERTCRTWWWSHDYDIMLWST